ncbi:hypothetical protein CARUB_v10015757mg [Capsella rubella]|uniref:F-box associated beta-propeller type 1 domain-containing protein n=1 Tax=Capsella rubella TaxID=81985 RepID=R0HJ12_9BRAS|nr:hypothetical protein CARUB_v10015757mg [Capsella rubella]
MVAAIAALFWHDHDVTEVWITTKIEADEVSWSKFLNLDMVLDNPIDLCKGSFFIDEVNKVAMVFENLLKRNTVIIIGEAGYVAEIDLGESAYPNSMPLVCPYVPSLVQIKLPARRKRKRQSSLENRRYARNMVKLFAFENNWDNPIRPATKI